MSSLRQIEANRRNAQKSTGPTSVTGKAASSMNALKTGIHAQSLVLPTEDPAGLDELVEDSYRSFHPTTPEARSLVDEFIYCEWNLRRLRAAETQSWQHQDHTAYKGPNKYPLGYSATHTRTPSPDSSTAWTPPAAPATAPSRPSSSSRPKPTPHPRLRPAAEPPDLPSPSPLIPNHFALKLASFCQPPPANRGLSRKCEPPR